MKAGDIKCDIAGEIEGLHPHMSAPAIYEYLEEQGFDASTYMFFITVRHPVEMLRSYFKYFEPDESSYYNYHPRYNSKKLCKFSEWIKSGWVGCEKYSTPHYPSFISDSDFTPLSLEAQLMGFGGKNYIDLVLKLEDQERIREFLISVFGSDCGYKKTNLSKSVELEGLDKIGVARIKENLSLEAAMYGL
jgi:hypothetical protein